MVLKRIYLDSNVFISFVRQEIGKHFRLLSVEASDFFGNCPGNFELIISDVALYEIKKIVYYSMEEVCDYLNNMQVRFVLVFSDSKDKFLAREFEKKGVHYPDSLHAALAVRCGCEAIVTFNKKDFELIISKIKVQEPLDLAQ